MDKIDALLPRVLKPSRYAGGELNQVVKAKATALRFAFCFPDVYEVGMSHLGSRILYHVLNNRADIACERAFMPWVDMEALMREEGVPLFTLETRARVADCDIVGFTLQYEMCATNVLAMLDLAGLALRASDRESGPLVVAGGPCAANPEPLAPFIDAFVIGDGEEATLEVCDACLASRAAGEGKAALLARLARLPGVYVPSLYVDEYDGNGRFLRLTPKDCAPAAVRRRVVRDLDAAPFPEKLILPFGEIVHDRVTLEVARGCTAGCRFCQAGMWYRPVRERSVATLLGQAGALIGCTGYEEISLSSLSTGDYTHLPALAKALVDTYREQRVSVSLPSLRIDSVIGDTLQQTGQVRKTSLTFAPEAATQRLRDVINKGVTEGDLLRAVRDAFEGGWSSIKLYAMIGLPTESEEDLDGMADLARKVLRVYHETKRQPGQKGVSVTISAASFVPKPHTPFQWCPQDGLTALMDKQKYLKRALRIPGVTFNWHDAQLSHMEAAVARGDRRVADAIENAYRLGCRLDGWSEHFKFDLWQQAFAMAGLSSLSFASRAFAVNEPLPWDHIHSGVSKAYLADEWALAQKAAATPDCRRGCRACGLQSECGGDACE